MDLALALNLVVALVVCLFSGVSTFRTFKHKEQTIGPKDIFVAIAFVLSLIWALFIISVYMNG